MLTLYSYPDLFGVADNNPYGLKVYAFLKLCKLAFRHEHILDAAKAPRGQLPYLLDDEKAIGDSDAIIAHLIAHYGLQIDDCLTASERDMDHLIRRMLDDLYWVMSYSRWKDPRFWPLFRDTLLRTHPAITEAALETARDYNFNAITIRASAAMSPRRPTPEGSRICES
jgi:glutathione S-transferase